MPTYTEERLSIEIIEEQSVLRAIWRGKSDSRNPEEFIAPILDRIINTATLSKKSIIMNFENMALMNSSTIIPLIKMLTSIKKTDLHITYEYNKRIRWQHLNFNALKALESPDGRITITAIT